MFSTEQSEKLLHKCLVFLDGVFSLLKLLLSLPEWRPKHKRQDSYFQVLMVPAMIRF